MQPRETLGYSASFTEALELTKMAIRRRFFSLTSDRDISTSVVQVRHESLTYPYTIHKKATEERVSKKKCTEHTFTYDRTMVIVTFYNRCQFPCW